MAIKLLTTCTGQNCDVHSGRPNVTPGTSATTNTNSNMDQKELEDRLAAAEALSSLALPFREPSPAQVGVQVRGSNPALPPGRGGRGRGGRKRDRRQQEASSRESKSRSARGRGGGGKNVLPHVGDGSVASVSTTTTATVQALLTTDSKTLGQTDPGLSSPAAKRRTVTSAGSSSTDAITDTRDTKRGRGRAGGRGVKQQGTKLRATPHPTDDVKLPPHNIHDLGASVAHNCARSSPSVLFGPDSSVRKQIGLHHQQQDILHQVIQAQNEASSSTAALSSTVMSPVPGLHKPFPLLSGGTVAPLPTRLVAGAQSLSQITASNNALVRASSTSTLLSVAATSASNVLLVAATSASNATRANVPVSTAASATVGLDSRSLGSINLSPVIPNPSSLSSGVISLQLNDRGGPASTAAMTAVSQDITRASQLSPFCRDSGEKSLPLKKRRIIDSSSSASSLSLTVPNTNSYITMMSPTSTVVSGTSPREVVTSPSTQADESGRAPSRGSIDDWPPSTPPPPVSHLVGMLHPTVAMQLISEIHTSITADEDGDVPLHIAVVHENEAMVKKLIQLMALAGQRVDRYNKQHQTPLHLAVKLQSLASIQMLLEAGADPNLVDSTGLTCIHMAVQGRDLDCVEALLQWSTYPCDLNYRNFEGMAPIHTAVMNNDLEILQVLLEHGADINIMDGKSGRTVLFHAAETNQKAAVEILLRRGADPEIANYAGVVPAMAAQGRSHTTVARLLARAVEDDGVPSDGKSKPEPGAEVEDRPESKGQKPVLTRVLSGVSEENSVADESRSVSRDPVQHTSEGTLGNVSKTDSAAVKAGTNFPSSMQCNRLLVSSPGPAQSITTPLNHQGPSRGKDTRSEAARKLSSDQVPVIVKKMCLDDNVTMGGAASAPQFPFPGPTVLLAGGSKVGAKTGGRRKASVNSPDHVSMDTTASLRSTPNMPAIIPAVIANVNSVRDKSSLCEMSPVELVRSPLGLTAETETHGEVTKSRRDCNTGKMLSSGMVPASVLMMHSQLQTAADHNGGHAGPINIPMLPLEVNLPPALLRPLTQGMHRVNPLPMPVSSVVTAPVISTNITSPSSIAPSAAHSQPTRPLLLFRSAAVDPGSGERQVGLEVRHVTADALLALQTSPSNSVNPANRSLGHVPARATLGQTHSFLSSAQLKEMDRVPPISNHVSAKRLVPASKGYVYDSDPDQPKDLSLKRKGCQHLSEAASLPLAMLIKKEASSVPATEAFATFTHTAPMKTETLPASACASPNFKSLISMPEGQALIKSKEMAGRNKNAGPESTRSGSKRGRGRGTSAARTSTSLRPSASHSLPETTAAAALSTKQMLHRKLLSSERRMSTEEGRTISISEGGLITIQPDTNTKRALRIDPVSETVVDSVVVLTDSSKEGSRIPMMQSSQLRTVERSQDGSRGLAASPPSNPQSMHRKPENCVQVLVASSYHETSTLGENRKDSKRAGVREDEHNPNANKAEVPNQLTMSASVGSPQASVRSPEASVKSPEASVGSPQASVRSPQAGLSGQAALDLCSASSENQSHTCLHKTTNIEKAKTPLVVDKMDVTSDCKDEGKLVINSENHKTFDAEVLHMTVSDEKMTDSSEGNIKHIGEEG